MRRALRRGTPPTFIPPDSPNPVAQPSFLSWYPAENSFSEKNSAKKKSQTSGPEEILDLRRQYLEQLFEGSPDPVIIFDTTFRTQCVNQQFQRMFGYSAAEILGRSLDEILFPPDRSAEAQWIAQCLERGERLTLETQRRCKDGSLLDVSVSSAPLIIDGRTVAFYAIYNDISERKRAEALSSGLYRIAEKASATQDLQQFFAAIHGIVDELMCCLLYTSIHSRGALGMERQLLQQPSRPSGAAALGQHIVQRVNPLPRF